MDNELALLKRKLEREIRARKAAETLLEQKGRALWDANQVLLETNATLERRVEVRTREVRAASEALKRRAEELSRSQEHLARAQRIARMGSDLRNLRTDEAEWSDETYRIFGVTRESFVPWTANFLKMLHPDDLATVLATREKIKKAACPDPFEYRPMAR